MRYPAPAYGVPAAVGAKAGISKGVIIAIAVVVGILAFLGAVAIALGVGLGVGLKKNSSGSLLSAPTVTCNISTNASNPTCGCPSTTPVFSSRIINGQTATTNSWPWMVALYIGSRVCSGFLVTNQHVVTAANCVYGANISNITAYIAITSLTNRNSGTVRSISNVAINPSYVTTSYLNDVAVLKLSQNVTFSSTIEACCYGNNTSVPALNDHAVVTGWGEVSLISSPSDVLKQAVVQVQSPSTCGVSSTSSQQFCADYGGVSTCPADNGGPLMTSTNNAWTCSGIVTGGSSTCYSVGVYTRTSYYYSFIYNATLYL